MPRVVARSKSPRPDARQHAASSTHDANNASLTRRTNGRVATATAPIAQQHKPAVASAAVVAAPAPLAKPGGRLKLRIALCVLAGLLVLGMALAGFIREVDARSGLPGGLVSVVIAALPLLSPLFLVKELLPAAVEGWVATALVRKLCPRADVFEPRPHTEPDYADEVHAWAALPFRRDTADEVPPFCGDRACEPEDQRGASADLFFVGPTTHYSRSEWNADWNSSVIRYLVCEAIIVQQAMPFNHVARIYSPLIRQMTGFAYFAPNASEEARRAAADIAYGDVRRAFRHYVAHWNQRRPIFLAGHSQGAEYMLRLLRDEFGPESELRQRLVVAYVVGMPVYERVLASWGVPACDGPRATGCVVSWMSFEQGADPFHFAFEPTDPALRSVGPGREKRVCVNPLSWALDGGYVGPEHNLGGMHIVQLTQNFMFLTGSPRDAPDDSHVQLQMNRVRDGLLPLRPHVVGAGCDAATGALAVDSPSFGESDSHFAYRFFPVWRFASFPGRNLHPMDYNFFWQNIRANAAERVAAWTDRYQRATRQKLSSAGAGSLRRK